MRARHLSDIVSAIYKCVLPFCLAAGLLQPAAAAVGQAPPEHVRFIAGYKAPGDFLDPMGIFFDEKAGEIYVADTGNGRVCVFTRDGMPVYEFNKARATDKTVNFGSPLDVAVNSKGTIFVSDLLLGQVIGMDFRGGLEYIIDFSQAESERLSPGRIAVDEDDNLFVADGTNNQILVFDDAGRFKFKFGKVEGENKVVYEVNSVFPDKRNSRVYVSNKKGTAVLVYDYEGNLLNGFGEHESGPANFSFPAGIVATPEGHIIVADTLRSEVKIFSPELVFMGGFGGIGQGVDAVIYPVDLALDSEGYLYVLEKTSRRVHIFSLEGSGGQ